MEYSIVKNSKINESLFRLDSEYHVGIQKINLDSLQGNKLSDICSKVVQGPNPKFIDSGIPSLNGKNIYFGTLDAGEPNYISEEEFKLFPSYHIKKNDILITLKHASKVGRLWVYRSNKDCLFSRNLGLLRVQKNSKINVETLLLYLWGATQQQLLNLVATGGTNGQITLSMAELREFPITDFSEELQNVLKIQFLKSELLADRSNTTKKEAEKQLLSELGLTNWQPKRQLTFVKNYSDTEHAGRIDAEYYQPKYEEIVKAIQNYSGGWDTLVNLCELVGHPSNPPYANTEDKDKTFIITQKHLGDFTLNDKFWCDEDALYTTQDFILKNRQYLLKKGDVLLYSVGAYIGKANIYKENIKATIGSFLTLLRTEKEKLNPYYLMAFLNTEAGIAISKQHQRGMAQQYLYPYDIRTFPIPILPETKQTQIQQKITDSFNLRKQSKHLLECAKRAVEMAIEEDEQKATKWLKEQTRDIGVMDAD